MTSVLMYDSTTASDIPVGAPAVAGYVDGAYRWSIEDWERFAHVRQVPIAVTYTDAGDCLDIENGDATIAQAPHWAGARQAAGVKRPWLYTSRSNFEALQVSIDAGVKAGICSAEVGYFIADWTGGAHDIAGADAVQFADPQTSGGHYDLSIVYGLWPDGTAVDAANAGAGGGTSPPPPAPSPGGSDVQVPQLQSGSSGQPVKAVQSILNGKAGARLATDGAFGPATEAAVKAWQTFFHLAVDGVVGPATWATLIDL